MTAQYCSSCLPWRLQRRLPGPLLPGAQGQDPVQKVQQGQRGRGEGLRDGRVLLQHQQVQSE